MAELSVLERVRLALIELEKSKRILICRPEHEAAVRAAVAELCPFEHLIEVRVDDWVPEGQFLLIDPNSLIAASRAATQRILHAHRQRQLEHVRRSVAADYRWAAGLVLAPDPRSAVIITGI